MRLQEVYFICKREYSSWPELKIENRKATGGGTYYSLTNIEEIKELLSNLDVIDVLSENIMQIRKTCTGFEQATGGSYLDVNSRNDLLKYYNLLNDRVGTIVGLFMSMGYMQAADGFDVKLPPNLSLSDLSKCAKDLDSIFSGCPLLTKLDGTITLAAVDVGSIWLSFLVGGVATVGILTMIAALVDKAIIIRSHYLSTEEQAEKIRSLKLGNDALETAEKLNRDVSKALLDRVASELADEHDIKEPEDVERLKHNIQVFADWMGKGLEVYAAVKAAPETKAVFSPIEVQSLPETALKLLEEKNEEI